MKTNKLLLVLSSYLLFGSKVLVADRVSIPFDLDKNFTSTENNILTEAIELLENRLDSKAVVDCLERGISAYEDKNGRGSTILMKSNYFPIVVGDYELAPHRLPNPRMQVYYLKTILDAFPTLTIHRFSKEDTVRGYAERDTHVHVPYGSSTKDDIDGEFEIFLNGYQIENQSPKLPEKDHWAGVIWHEMMHNLGHLHPKDDYSTRFQINIYQRCVAYNGKRFAEGENGEAPLGNFSCGKHHLNK